MTQMQATMPLTVTVAHVLEINDIARHVIVYFRNCFECGNMLLYAGSLPHALYVHVSSGSYIFSAKHCDKDRVNVVHDDNNYDRADNVYVNVVYRLYTATNMLIKIPPTLFTAIIRLIKFTATLFTACLSGVTSPRHSASAVDIKP